MGDPAARRRTPLHARHLEAGARMVGFAGWDMPIHYGSIVDEHHQVRRRAGLFDVSHMGEIRLRGPDALAFAQRVFTNDVTRMRDGHVRYGLLCNPEGGVIDDVTLYRVAADQALLCVNAARSDADLGWLRDVHASADLDCEIVDESAETALLAAQGPGARALVDSLARREAALRRWRFGPALLAGVEVLLSRTGYTGEDGYEIFVHAERATQVWDALLDEPGPAELRPVGLGARDTLRTEMAYPLYGHELSLETDPLEADLERFVAFGTGFIGEPALRERKARGARRLRLGLWIEGRAIARPGAEILSAGAPAGVVTSGTFGPSVERSIAIGYVRSDLATGELTIDVRGRKLPCRRAETPFYRPGTQGGPRPVRDDPEPPVGAQ